MAFQKNLLVCAPISCGSVEETLASMEKAKAEGADLVELRLDSMSFSHISQLHYLITQRSLPTILSLRLNESLNGCKVDSRNISLQVLSVALQLDVEFVEIDYEVASDISTMEHNKPSKSQIIVSSYVNGGRPSRERLGNLVACMQSTGADVVKLIVEVNYITEVAPILQMLTHCQVPLIATAVGSRGLISQLLAPKFGGFLVYGCLKSQNVPGLPSLVSLKQVYQLDHVNPWTQIFGLISNPVSHSKSPILHNYALRHIGYNGIYVPLLVDNLKEFFSTYESMDFTGFSVGIPHKEAAVACCDEVHPLAKSIGAVNTIIRRPTDGKLIGYNTDCEACITAIEDALREREIGNGGVSHVSPIAGKIFVLVGAGGAGRALAFGAKERGARVVVFNRKFERAKALAAAVSGEALPYECLDSYCPENGMILANASAIGMEPNTHKTPVPKEALRAYKLVFDAVYTPRITRLLCEAEEVGAIVVSGVEMFIRQALGQFRLFTNGPAPEDVMRKLVQEQF